jgi:hypothetical protein
MKPILAALALGISMVATPSQAGNANIQLTEIGKSHMEFDCPARAQLRLHVRSGEIRIAGTNDSKITVDLSGKNLDRIQDVKARLSCSHSVAELHVSGGPRNDLVITIRVPKNVDLFARIPAGEVTVEEIAGNKDVELSAGELTIFVGKPTDYAHVDASVYAGEVDAEIFGASKSGLFRTFSKDANGQYHLHAHVGSGQLTLR